MQVYRNCYVRADRSNPAAEQREAIAATGPMSGRHAKTLEEEKDFTTLARLLKTVRRGEFLVVSELHRLADSIEGLRAFLHKAQAKGVIILVAFSGRRSDNLADWADEILEVREYYQRHRLSKAAARRAGRKGGQAKAAKMREAAAQEGEPLPAGKALARWNCAVKRGATAAQAIDAVNEGVADAQKWSYDKLRRLARQGKLPGELKTLPPGRRRT